MTTVPTINTPIPTVFSFAFVASVYDYVDVHDVSPSVDENNIGYVVWTWDIDDQEWSRGGIHDCENEAREEALVHHNAMRAKLRISSTCVSPLFERPAEIEEDGDDER